MNRIVLPSDRPRRRRAPARVVARLPGRVARGLLLALALGGLAAHAQAAAARDPGRQAPAAGVDAIAANTAKAPPAAATSASDGVAGDAAAVPASVGAIAVEAPPAAAAPSSATTSSASAIPASRQLLAMLRSPVEHARIDGSYGGGYGDAARARSQARIAARIAAAHGFSLVTQWPMPTLGMDCMVLALPPGTSVEAGIAALQSHAEVVWAQPMNEFEAQGRAEPPPGRAEARPNSHAGHADPLFPLQPAATQWHLDDLHAVATGRRVRVALLDSGVDPAHPDLAQAVEVNENFVGGQPWAAEHHGTAVAGLVAARADNGIGIVGIAPEARLLALRACWEVDARQTLCNSLSLAKALNFAIEHHAEIINMSLSGPADPLLGRLIDVALARRQQVVAAVDPRASDGGFPADHPGVIAVADALAPLPAGLPGAWTAPARDLPATAPGGGWRMVSGSSFAAGQVSGLLAVLLQARADAGARPFQVLASPADGAAATPRLVRLPGGGIDACASLLRVAAVDAGSGCRAMVAVSAGAGASAAAGAGVGPSAGARAGAVANARAGATAAAAATAATGATAGVNGVGGPGRADGLGPGPGDGSIAAGMGVAAEPRP
ncbi:MAG: S8 family peptidase [Burkholderiaceae bacterium]